MRCVEFDGRLNELLDDRLDPARDEQLRSHAQQCERCEDRLHWNSAVMAALPIEVLNPVCLAGFSTQRRVIHRAAWAGLALVAAVILVCLNLPTTDNVVEHRAEQPADMEVELELSPDMLAIWGVLDQIPKIPMEENARFVTEPIVGGILPIRNSLGMAFGALRDTLPGKRRNVQPQPPQAGRLPGQSLLTA